MKIYMSEEEFEKLGITMRGFVRMDCGPVILDPRMLIRGPSAEEILRDTLALINDIQCRILSEALDDEPLSLCERCEQPITGDYQIIDGDTVCQACTEKS